MLHSLPGAAGQDVSRNVSGDCAVSFETGQRWETFLPSYRRRLQAAGWTVKREPEAATNTIDARRGPWRLSVEHTGDRRPGGDYLVAAYVLSAEP